MKRAFLAACAAAFLLHVGGDGHLRAQTPASPLGFFQGYFVTGDYVVSGVGLDSTGSGTIQVAGVPTDLTGSDVVAAFLYWQVVTRVDTPEAGGLGARFKGNLLESTEGIFAKVLGNGTPTCSNSGGATGSPNGSWRTFTYRADVLRYFGVDASGKLAVNGAHAVELPVSSNVAPLGASLLIVHRQSDSPLRAVVIYDGAYTMDQSTEGMSLTMQGFYDGKPGPARLTHIGGSGQANKPENTRFNGALLSTNAFTSALGPLWDNPTFAVTTPAPAAGGVTSQVTTSVAKEDNGSFDCVTFAAAVFSTEVEDADGDGLLDVWEESATPILDPNGVALPNLNLMGASPDQKDVFVEIGYMFNDQATYGGVLKPAHSHEPGPEALKLIGDAFEGGGVTLHIDIGPWMPGDYAPDTSKYLVPSHLARGGEAVHESVTQCAREPGEPEWVCQFSAHPGTVGWKTGFRFLRDELLNPPPLNPDGSDPCDLPGNTCERRFDQNRLNMFRYAFFAHFVGLPKSVFPCLDGTTPVDAFPDDVCHAPLVPNPDFHIPRTNSGIADFPGADALVTLGGFQDVSGLPTGTPFHQASTFMHEFGHNFERRHGGEAFEPNCKPSYLSVMNYLYQLRGLLDDDGQPHLDFARERPSATIDEANLNPLAADALFRLGWYVPLETSYLAGLTGPALKHCNGSDLLPTDVTPMVRINARFANTPIDWDGDENPATVATAGDVNFSGVPGERLLGSESVELGNKAFDWPNLLLNQIGIRRNVGALYIESGTNRFAVGAYSIGTGKGDIGKGDIGKGDIGKGDIGKGDIGKGDIGKGDIGKGDIGKGDIGGGDLFLNDPNNPEGELDAETAGDLARTPPNVFQACVIGETCSAVATPLHDVLLTWSAPNVSGVQSYRIFRVEGNVPTVSGNSPILTVDAQLGQTVYSAIDSETLVDGQQYTYFALADYGSGIVSDASRLATITAVNDPPSAGDDSYSTQEDTPLSVPAPGVLANDADPDDPGVAGTAELVSGLSPAWAGTLDLQADGSFTFVPAANYNNDGVSPATFTYRVRFGSIETNVATVSITVTAANDPPTISDIGDVTIVQNGTTGPIAFTIGDVEDPMAVQVSGTSGNPVLVPPANIVFGGTGADRTVTVTPAPNQSGAALITVTATDGGGASASDTFTVTVQPGVKFVAVQNLPPSKTKAGSTTSMKWQFHGESAVIDSSAVSHTVEVVGPCTTDSGPCIGGTVRIFTNTDSGGSSFRYSGNTWTFNLQTKDNTGMPYPVGHYRLTIKPSTPGFPQSPTYSLQLMK